MKFMQWLTIGAAVLGAVVSVPPGIDGALGMQDVRKAPTRPEATTGSARSVGHRIEAALVEYRALVRAGGWVPVEAGAVLEPGMRDERVVLLRQRLAATRDIETSSGPSVYDSGLVRAVRRFQRRHGLEADGRIGPRTLATLNVPAEAREAQLALNLARWRQLAEPDGIHIRVNTAAATLEVIHGEETLLHMRVVVGAARTPTPDFRSEITAAIFNPAWTILASIAAHEILPRLKRDAAYLAANDIRILGRERDPYGRAVDWQAISPGHFPFRLRQAPGLGNPLGRIKFEIPNPYDIYLHDTPEKRLFLSSDRARSHGCIRLADARELAALLLVGSPGWDLVTMDAAIASGETRHVAVSVLPVVVAYLTAFVDVNGEVHFREDVYGRDFRVSNARPGPTARAGAM